MVEAPWVAKHGLTAPYGECQCGCGRVAPITKYNDKRSGCSKGCPSRFMSGHGGRSHPPSDGPNPGGFCMCGCGQLAPISYQTNKKADSVKGRPQRYILGHNKGFYPTLADGFWAYCAPGASNACWEWQGCKDSGGYGQFSCLGNHHMSHRTSYELHYGPVPGGLWVLHKCDNPPCCNPNHLFLGTDVDNVADKVSKLRHAYGERAPGAKLQESDVVEIRKLSGLGIPNLEIARRYRVTGSAIGSLLRGETWRRVP